MDGNVDLPCLREWLQLWLKQNILELTFESYRPRCWIDVRPRNGSCHGRDDLHGGLEATYVIARGCGGRTAS